MTTPAQWAELVTTALLGTDRRPLDVVDPPAEVLHLAARHRILDRLAATGATATGATATATGAVSSGARTATSGTRVDPTPAAPVQDRPEAPDAADQLLGQLLSPPDPVLVSCWLQVCADHGSVVASVRWTALGRLAARSTAYDRVALATVLGPRGRWFLRQNPEWRRLAADAEQSTADAEESTTATADRTSPSPSPAPEPDRLRPEDVLIDPERLLGHPQPWTPDLVSAAYAVLGGEGQVPPARSYATRLGVALPTELYPSIARAGEYYVLAPDTSPARRRTVRDRFVALELAAYARAAIQHAFTDGTTGFTRAEIPHV